MHACVRATNNADRPRNCAVAVGRRGPLLFVVIAVFVFAIFVEGVALARRRRVTHWETLNVVPRPAYFLNARLLERVRLLREGFVLGIREIDKYNSAYVVCEIRETENGISYYV